MRIQGDVSRRGDTRRLRGSDLRTGSHVPEELNTRVGQHGVRLVDYHTHFFSAPQP